MTVRGEAIGAILECMDLMVQILIAVMSIIQDRMTTWQIRARAEEQEDLERASAEAAQRGKGKGTGLRPPAPPAIVHLRPRPYTTPTGKGHKGKMKEKAKMVAAVVGAPPGTAFRFLEAVEDPGLAEDAD